MKIFKYKIIITVSYTQKIKNRNIFIFIVLIFFNNFFDIKNFNLFVNALFLRRL